MVLKYKIIIYLEKNPIIAILFKEIRALTYIMITYWYTEYNNNNINNMYENHDWEKAPNII